MFLFAESEASWEEWWTYDGISGEFFSFSSLGEIKAWRMSISDVRQIYLNRDQWSLDGTKYMRIWFIIIV